MALTDLQITSEQITNKGIVNAPDKLTGTAAENKAMFDRLVREIVAVQFNALVDALTATSGAGEIGAAVDGITEKNVLGVLAALKALRDSDFSAQGATNTSLQAEIENRYTKAQTDALVTGKFDTAKANELIKSIVFNSENGVFTITTQGGAVQTIDTLLEKVPASFSLVNNQLVLTLEDGTKQTADLSAFIDTYTFTSGGTVVFSQTGKNITAEVKDGSLALSKLTSEAQSTLAGYATRAETAKEAAEAAKTAAEAAKTTAQSAATTATNQASNASSSATSANSSKNAAATSASTANSAAARAESAATRAEKAAEEAEAAAGGDFVSNDDFNSFKETTEETLAELENNTAVFVAEYEVTTLEEITAAVNAGRTVILRKDALRYMPVQVWASTNMYTFARLEYSEESSRYGAQAYFYAYYIEVSQAGWKEYEPVYLASMSQTVETTLSAASWTDNTYTLSLSRDDGFPLISTISNQEILPAVGITEEQLSALQAANLQDNGQARGKIYLKAFGDVPTIDIPIRVIVRGDA